MREIEIDGVLERLDELVEQTAKGDAFIVTKDGKAVARVEPFDDSADKSAAPTEQGVPSVGTVG